MELELTTIRELDDSRPSVRSWSGHEIYILERYYGKVPCRDLTQYLPNRSMKAIQNKAYHLGLTNTGGV